MIPYFLKIELRASRAVATYTGPRDSAGIARLYEFLLANKWRGQLLINVSDGGTTEIIFDEKPPKPSKSPKISAQIAIS